MTITHAAPEPYSSLEAVRRANDELIEKLPEDESHRDESERQSAETRTMEFIARVVETGTVLDTPADRKVAQGFINYWAARPYAAPGDRSAKSPASIKTATLLKPFDATIMRLVVERSDTSLQSFGPTDQALARRILLRLLRISDGTSVSSPRVKAGLCSADEAERATQILEQLRAAGVVAVRPSERGDVVELRYAALVRHWQTLADWIDERVKFREATLFWVRTGRDDGALLSDKLAKAAAEYGDLSDLEEEFVAKSVAHAHRQQFIIASIAGVAAALVLSLSLALLYLYFYEWVPHEAKGESEVARASDKPTKRRVDAIRWLADARRDLDLSEAELKDSSPIDLTELHATSRWSFLWSSGRVRVSSQWNFIKAELQNVDFSKSVLPNIWFNGAAIDNSHFDGAKLQNARFDEARISNTSFSGSNLVSAVFDRAQLCHVNFSKSDIAGASFRYVAYDDLPDFKETAWWLATGWTLEQVDALKKLYPAKNSDIPTFSQELKKHTDELKANPSPGTLEYVRAQDGIAWAYAIYGIELDKAEAAAKEARQGLSKLPSTVPPYQRKRMESYTADTLGYVLMQKAQIGQAEIGEALGPLKVAADFQQNAGATFRYALALHKSGRDGYAVESLKTAMFRGYSPSHELYLLPDYFSQSGEFIKVFRDSQPRLETDPPKDWCR